MPDVVTLREIAQRLRISEATARRLSRNGGLPEPLRVGRQLRWPAAVVERFIVDGMPAATVATDSTATRGA